MTDTSQVNPYAPSQVLSERPLEPSHIQPQVRTGKVMLATFAGVMISGGLFGVIAAILFALRDTGIADLVIIVPMGMIAGAFVAGVFALPIMFIAVCVTFMTVAVSRGWTFRQIGWFGGVCGFFSGWLSFALLFGPGLASLALGIAPSALGCVGTILLANWILRPRRVEAPIRHESVVTPAANPAPLPTDPNNT